MEKIRSIRGENPVSSCSGVPGGLCVCVCGRGTSDEEGRDSGREMEGEGGGKGVKEAGGEDGRGKGEVRDGRQGGREG